MNLKKEKLVDFITIYSVIFTFATILSSIVQLSIMDRLEDTNSHILFRAVVVLIGTLSYKIEVKLKSGNKIVEVLVNYVVVMAIVLIFVFISGFFEELHPNAYRDIILNFTPFFIVLTLIKEFNFKRK
ncbi:DUF6608 family protein [Anaerosphaera multitolerans]|uniref:Uncharacterized protein n=1 Tax=Anaerosphaera multitolerans TaxID=2487351 RepID=A0A437S6M6_9FIRM|nr:DUF6608 family protein [Anaerosphaera multitolerans]RVU54669.1 hypothetical protein EF514_06085 [Anaerosphaera multitolerans]